MSAFIATLPAVMPVVEMGVGNTHNPTGAARWDIAEWAPDDAVDGDRWNGAEPAWYDITCFVQDITTFSGRDRAGMPFEIGTASIVADNKTGWADYTDPGSPATETLLSVRPGRDIRVGVRLNGSSPYWLWRGYIDQANPGFEVNTGPTITLECIDAKGEVGRVQLPEIDPAIADNETATARINRILDDVSWLGSDLRRDIWASSVAMTPYGGGAQAVDLLDQTADSCGGAVFGDTLGRICFRGRDWQTLANDAVPDYTISNLGQEAEPAVPDYEVTLSEDPADSGLVEITEGVEESDAPGLLAITHGYDILEDPGGSDLYSLWALTVPGWDDDVCPSGWEVVNSREDIATRVLVGRADDPTTVAPLERNDLEGQAMFGVETFDRLDLTTKADIDLDELADRFARIYSWRVLPRLAVTVTARRDSPQSMALLATATPFQPSLYQCIHAYADRTIFARMMFAVAVEHALSPEGWQARISLDAVDPWLVAQRSGRWSTTASAESAYWTTDPESSTATVWARPA